MNGKTALVIIDVQNMLVNEGPYQADRMIDTINGAIALFREKGLPVIFVQHTNEELLEGSEGWQIYGGLDAREEDLRVKKSYNSMFKETALEGLLQKAGIKRLVICGMQTDWCVDTSVKVAFEKGYELLVLKEAFSTFDSSIPAEAINEFFENIWSGGFAKLTGLEQLAELV